jgi:DNA-binding NarL/FixJ family response regulator
MIRLFIVDDHAVLRHGLRALFKQQAELTIVGKAENGGQLLAQLPTTPCDVVLLDLHMPELDGLATTLRLHAEFPGVRVLILSMVDNELAIGQVLAAGALGYVLKNAGHDEILVAVRAVTASKRFLCSKLGLTMVDKVLATSPVLIAVAKPMGGLSAREQEVLQLVADGLTT